MNHAEQQAAQREYYAGTADRYDAMHYHSRDEHQFALALMHGLIDLFGIGSILDIGSGTGRALMDLKHRFPGVRIVGVEPSPELREIGYAKGLGRDELVDGDARRLPYADGEFDLVCEFATLHHVPMPRQAVQEMLRVARTAVYISDSNKFGQGGRGARVVKALVGAAGLWPLFDRIRTRGKGYMTSETDGLFYSYSVFDDYELVRRACASVHAINTVPSGLNVKRSASHVALLGLKEPVLTKS